MFWCGSNIGASAWLLFSGRVVVVVGGPWDVVLWRGLCSGAGAWLLFCGRVVVVVRPLYSGVVNAVVLVHGFCFVLRCNQMVLHDWL